jgi:hypothetical protein
VYFNEVNRRPRTDTFTPQSPLQRHQPKTKTRPLDFSYPSGFHPRSMITVINRQPSHLAFDLSPQQKTKSATRKSEKIDYDAIEPHHRASPGMLPHLTVFCDRPLLSSCRFTEREQKLSKTQGMSSHPLSIN